MTILIKPFLYLIAFGPLAVLFASVFGLACWLLMVCVRAISLGRFTWLQVSARSARGQSTSSTDATNAGELAVARLAPSGPPAYAHVPMGRRQSQEEAKRWKRRVSSLPGRL